MLENFFKSFTSDKEGWSGRKLSAFDCFIMANVVSIVGCRICYEMHDAHTLLYFQWSWLVTGVVCLGLVTIPQLIETLKTWKGENTDNSNKDQKTEENVA